MSIGRSANYFSPAEGKSGADYVIWSKLETYWIQIQAIKRDVTNNDVEIQGNGRWDLGTRLFILGFGMMITVGAALWQMKNRIGRVTRLGGGFATVGNNLRM